MANFPTADPSFTTKSAGNTITAAFFNDPQEEIVAIGSTLRNGQARCQVSNSGTQAIPDDALTAVTFDTEDFDVGSMHSTASNTSRLTVPAGAGGVYLLTAHLRYDANATGVRGIRFLKNGTDALTTTCFHLGFSDSGSGPVLQLTVFASLAAGDYVEVQAYQNSTGSLNLDVNPRFACVRVW